jgi:hypothetical protein
LNGIIVMSVETKRGIHPPHRQDAPEEGPPGRAGAVRRSARLLAFAMLATFAGTRISLHAYPGTDLNVLGYNIHHLFTGILLTTASSIPLAVGSPRAGRVRDVLLLVFGAGLALVLDEWVYLLATDGSNSSYLLPVSYLGGAVMMVLALALIAVVARGGSRPR